MCQKCEKLDKNNQKNMIFASFCILFVNPALTFSLWPQLLGGKIENLDIANPALTFRVWAWMSS